MTVALVTGANTGIGKEIARLLAGEGMTVFVGSRSREKGMAAVAEIAGESQSAPARCDRCRLGRRRGRSGP